MRLYVQMLLFVNMMCSALAETGIARAGPVHISPMRLTSTYLMSHLKIHCLSPGDILDLNSDGLAGVWFFMAGMPCEGISLQRKSSAGSVELPCSP